MFYPSPGFLAEKMTIYLATELTAGEQKPMEDERIETRWFTARELDEADRIGQDSGREDADRLPQVEALFRKKVNIASSACARWLTRIFASIVGFAEGAAEGLVIKQRIVAEAAASRAARR